MVLGGVLPANMALTVNTQTSGAGSGGAGGTLRARCNTGMGIYTNWDLSFIFFFQLLKDFCFVLRPDQSICFSFNVHNLYKQLGVPNLRQMANLTDSLGHNVFQ